MTDTSTKQFPSIYDQWSPPYAEAGYQPRQIAPGGKKPAAKGWQDDVATVPAKRGPSYGLGLRLGTKLPDSTILVVLDADRDDFTRLARALVQDPCGRFGSKGTALFVRVAEPTKKFDLKLADGSKAGEFLGTGSQCVIPPTIHPDTHQPYVWTDTPLLEFGWENLPLVDPKLIKEVFASEHLPVIMSGEQTHDAMLKFTGHLVHLTDDDDLIEQIALAALPEDYQGDSRDELHEMITGARGKVDSGKWAVKQHGRFPDVTNNGKPRPTLPNTKKAIVMLGIEVRFDLFKLQQLIGSHTLDSYFVGTVSDPALFRIRELIYDSFGFDPPTNVVHDAVQTLANHHRFHPVCDYLGSLVWDGQPRLDNWLTTYAGVEATPFVRAVGSLTLIAAVRRVRQPGVKFDEWLIMEGEQGSGKSQALQILAGNPKWFTDQKIIGLTGKEAIEAISGKWIIEAAELHGMKNSDVEGLKSFMSRDTDRGRMAYARTPTEGERQCIVIGTTNSDKYLRDLTGNRRMWPVVTTKFDLEALKRDRDQLWAEAAFREAEGGSIRLPEELWPAAAEQQRQRVVENPFIAILDEVLREPSKSIFGEDGKLVRTEMGEPMNGIITKENLWTLVGVRPASRSQYLGEQLNAAMKELGWVETRNRVGGGRRAYGFKRGDDDRHISVYPGDHGDRATVVYDQKIPGNG